MKRNSFAMQYFYLLHALLHGIFIISPVIILGVITKFLVIGKQKNQKNNHSVILASLAVGSQATTHDGRQGIIINCYEQSVILELVTGEKIEVQHYAIQSVR